MSVNKLLIITIRHFEKKNTVIIVRICVIVVLNAGNDSLTGYVVVELYSPVSGFYSSPLFFRSYNLPIYIYFLFSSSLFTPSTVVNITPVGCLPYFMLLANENNELDIFVFFFLNYFDVALLNNI